VSTVAVLGAGGFVGTAVAKAFSAAGAEVCALTAPRLDVAWGTDPLAAAAAWREASQSAFAKLVAAIGSSDVVINAAGLATPTAPKSGPLWGADAVLPAVVVLAAVEAGAARVVHFSSAAVQGSLAVLDEEPFVKGQTPYAEAKGAGEGAATGAAATAVTVVVYRPTSVLGEERPIAARLASVLRSPVLVMPPGDPPLPVALVSNVGAATTFLASLSSPPPIVLHPWEGMTVASLAHAFGRMAPLRRLPGPLVPPLRWSVRKLVQHGGGLAGKVRRVEMLWEGQGQRSSLPGLGFAPREQLAAYCELGRLLTVAQGTG
jgi:nucleoside-diphosphate-sugar epimerase